MAIFQDLPAEIILGILQFTFLPELKEVAQVNRALRKLASPILKIDRNAKAKCQIFRCVLDVRAKTKLLCGLLLTPRAAHYVEQLDLWGWFKQWQPATLHDAGHDKYPPQVMDPFRRAIVGSKLIPHDLKDEWVYKLEQGDEDPIMALLCMILPNLRILEIEETIIAHACFSTYLRCLLQQPSVCYSSLEEVYLRPYPNIKIPYIESQWSESIKLICQLPSLRVIECSDLEHGIDDDDEARIVEKNRPERTSNLLCISLQECAFNLQLVQDMLSCTGQLREFDYSPMASWTPDAAYTQGICDSLRAFAKHSLQSLRLRSFVGQSEPQEPHPGNLKEFASLEAVEIETSVLLGTPAMGRYSLVHELPKSIRTVLLHEDHSREAKFYLMMLDELVREKATLVPDLLTLGIVGLRSAFQEISQSTMDLALRSIGVELALEREYDYVN